MNTLRPGPAHALLHFTVFIWGFTAILGRVISVPAVPIVWYRVAIVVVVMSGIIAWRKAGFLAPRRTVVACLGIGVLVALHWLCFYGCIKYSGIAVSVLCLSSVTFFTALIEPIVFRRAPVIAELVIGGAVVAGVALLVKVETNTNLLGLSLGLGSALFSAGFGTLNGRMARSERAERITLYEQLSAFVVTSAFFFVWPEDFVAPLSLGRTDALLLLLLGVGCTVLPWLWSLRVLKTLSPYTVALAVTLEPVYSMAMAWFLFPESEQLTWRFYLGAALLVALVVANAWLKRPRATPAGALATGPSVTPKN